MLQHGFTFRLQFTSFRTHVRVQPVPVPVPVWVTMTTRRVLVTTRCDRYNMPILISNKIWHPVDRKREDQKRTNGRLTERHAIRLGSNRISNRFWGNAHALFKRQGDQDSS